MLTIKYAYYCLLLTFSFYCMIYQTGAKEQIAWHVVEVLLGLYLPFSFLNLSSLVHGSYRNNPIKHIFFPREQSLIHTRMHNT